MSYDHYYTASSVDYSTGYGLTYAPTSSQAGHSISRPVQDISQARKRPKYTRSKTGCMTCRIKKVKCDEAKPNCMRCMHGQRECTWPDNAVKRKTSPAQVDELSDSRPSTADSSDHASDTSRLSSGHATPPSREYANYARGLPAYEISAPSPTDSANWRREVPTYNMPPEATVDSRTDVAYFARGVADYDMPSTSSAPASTSRHSVLPPMQLPPMMPDRRPQSVAITGPGVHGQMLPYRSDGTLVSGPTSHHIPANVIPTGPMHHYSASGYPTSYPPTYPSSYPRQNFHPATPSYALGHSSDASRPSSSHSTSSLPALSASVPAHWRGPLVPSPDLMATYFPEVQERQMARHASVGDLSAHYTERAVYQ